MNVFYFNASTYYIIIDTGVQESFDEININVYKTKSNKLVGQNNLGYKLICNYNILLHPL